VSFQAPHVQDRAPRQFIYKPKYGRLYADTEFEKPATAGPEYFYGAFPSWFTQENEARKRWRMRFATPEMFQESMKGYYRLITGVDDAVDGISKTLDKHGMADNTVILFLGDNGFYLAEHGMAGKWYGHQESIRIPMVIYDPRSPDGRRGVRVDRIVLNIDVAPTILELAGLHRGETIQGESLLPLWRGEEVDWREDFLYEHLWYSRFPIHPTEGVVSKQFKYLRYPGNQPAFEELYDLSEDPLEKNNLAQDAAHYELLMRMRARCDALIQQSR
jgi:arylsulfatase A-like enzyme